MNLMRRPHHPSSRLLHSISDELSDRTHQMANRPYATGGIILLILSVIGFIWIFPEIRRYLRIERM
jgi:hypothetical protein